VLDLDRLRVQLLPLVPHLLEHYLQALAMARRRLRRCFL
jgi:hypothetical protein